MEKITIETAEHGFNVSQGDKNAEVGWDEMLGLIASLTIPENRPCLQWMETEERRTEKRAAWSKAAADITIVPLGANAGILKALNSLVLSVCAHPDYVLGGDGDEWHDLISLADEAIEKATE